MRPSEDPRGVVLKYTWPNSGKLELEPGIYSYSCQLEPEVLQHLVISLPIGSATDSSVCQCTPAAPCGRHLPSSQSKAETKPSQSDHRTLPARVVAPTHEWRRLEHCVSAWELGECLLHALLGWLRAIRAFSQGDGAAGGRGSEATTWNHERSHAVPTRLAQQQDSGYSDGDFWTDCGEEVAVAAQRLEHALANLNAGLSTEFRALLIDEDMVANSGEYFISSVHVGVVSGTPEFMSDSLRMALRHDDKDYVQNPVDDLHSFMWTALWATVFNRRALEDAGLMEQQSVRMWREQLSGGGSQRDAVLNALQQVFFEPSNHAPLVKGMSLLFLRWIMGLRALQGAFKYAWRAPDARPDRKLHMFYRFALQGVAEYAELLYEQRDQLQALK